MPLQLQYTTLYSVWSKACILEYMHDCIPKHEPAPTQGIGGLCTRGAYIKFCACWEE